VMGVMPGDGMGASDSTKCDWLSGKERPNLFRKSPHAVIDRCRRQSRPSLAKIRHVKGNLGMQLQQLVGHRSAGRQR